MKGLYWLPFFFTLWLSRTSFAKDDVPVLIWNANQAQGGVPAVSALQSINYQTFQAKYLASFKPNNILLFLQDALSVEDLASHTSELHHLKQWMDKGHSLYLPNVEDASRLVHDLPAHGYNVVKLEHDAGLSLKQEDKNLVVVELPSTETNPSRRRALQKADEVMENVISKIGNLRDFTIIFTGKKPSVDERSDQYEQRIRVSRSLQAVTVKGTGSYHYFDCTKMFLKKNITMNFSNDDKTKSYNIPEAKAIPPDTGSCGENENTLLVKYSNIDINGIIAPKLLVTWHFSRVPGYSWILDSVNVASSKKEDLDVTLELISEMDEVPIGMSYACSEKLIFANKTSKVELVLQEYQIEAFTTKARFNDVWDCIGFFTIPIWCGLLSTLILVIILTIGLFMLSDIKTMDRFDDPKAQPLNVPSSD